MPNKTFIPIDIRRACYAMTNANGTEAEISMYGDIVESQPINYWTGEPVEGDFIIQDEFLADLNTIISSGCKKLTLRMHSYGGDAGVSILIHNRLREISASGIQTVCIVDGVAMSGGSLIMCACDNVRVNPSSLIMIHKAWSFLFGGYNADEMRSKAKESDAWDKAQVEIYKRKCGMSDAVIMHMMSETATMTGREAFEKGFADEIIEDAEPLNIAASADRTAIFVKGQKLHLARGMTAPENIPIATPGQGDVNKITTKNEGGITMAKNLEELRAENPELASAVEAEVRAAATSENAANEANAANTERQRLADIDEIAHLYDAETVREAKYGENRCSAADMAFRAAQKAAKNGTAFMANAASDFAESGAAAVTASPTTPSGDAPATPEQKLADARTNVKTLLGKN
ncbi:MAG: Clp protease ClpP [Ruminococcaceae bacterium]|nr:Clp protease ClpP [Oscillospiraceae bacterium]